MWQQTARNLLAYLTARQNVELPLLLNGVGKSEREARAADLLARVGLAERGDHRPERAVRWRAAARRDRRAPWRTSPRSCSPTSRPGELDTTTAREVFELLRSVNQELGVTIVVVTHDPLVSEQVSRTIAIRDGRTSTETLRRRAVTDEGDHHVISEEYAVLDRAGRLQLPRGLRRARSASSDGVRLALEPDHITIRPDADRGSTNGNG